MIFGTDPPVRPKNWFSENLPNLRESDCKLTSRCTYDYNCVGFVVGDFRWWHPEDLESHYWPSGVNRDLRKWAHLYVTALQTERFEPLNSAPQFDPRFENIVIFQKGGQFAHAALQASETTWMSKLGSYRIWNILYAPCHAEDTGKSSVTCDVLHSRRGKCFQRIIGSSHPTAVFYRIGYNPHWRIASRELRLLAEALEYRRVRFCLRLG